MGESSVGNSVSMSMPPGSLVENDGIVLATEGVARAFGSSGAPVYRFTHGLDPLNLKIT